MRKIRNNRIHTHDPAVLFARGVEQLVDDHLYHPGRDDGPELKKLRREAKQLRPNRGFFSLLLRPFSI